MAEPNENGGFTIRPGAAQALSWVEPEPHGCELLLPLNSPKHSDRNARIFAEAQARLDQKGA